MAFHALAQIPAFCQMGERHLRLGAGGCHDVGERSPKGRQSPEAVDSQKDVLMAIELQRLTIDYELLTATAEAMV